MHQGQFIKALTHDLEHALELAQQHVQRWGGVDNWWSWEVAFIAGEVRLREHAIPDDTTDEERAWLAEQDAATIEKYGDEHAWLSGPWLQVFSNGALAGVPYMKLDDEVDEAEQATRTKLEELDGDGLSTFFLEQAAAALRDRYAQVALPPEPTGIEGLRRGQLASAFETVYNTVLVPYGDRAAHLPYLRDQNPYDWPAHLVGEGEGAVYLLIDMHL